MGENADKPRRHHAKPVIAMMGRWLVRMAVVATAGLGVLTLFGLFERKRNEMLRLLGELRTWER